MRFKKLSPSRLYRSKRLEQMCWRLRLCSSVRCLGTHLAATFWNPKMSCTKELAVPWLMPSCNAIYSIVTLLSARIMALASSSLSSVVYVDGRPERSASITLVRPFSNISIHPYTLLRGNAFFPYCVHKRAWISAPLTPSAHNNLMTLLCSSLVQTERLANMFTTQQLLTHWGWGPAIVKVRQTGYCVQCCQASAV